jgi:hypothetical protein
MEQHLVCYGRGRGPFRRSPKDAASQRNYYAIRKEGGTWDDSIEKLIDSTVEAPGLPIIQKLASGNTRLTWQDRNELSLLIAFQKMRTPSARERVRTFSRILMERVLHEIRTADPNQTSVNLAGKFGTGTLTLHEMTQAHEEICDDHRMEIHRSLVGPAIKLSERYKHMKFTVHYRSGNTEYITTDNPVIRVFHNAEALGAGVDRPDVEIRFPLSRTAFLTLTHDLRFIARLERARTPERNRLLGALPEVRIARATDSDVTAFNRAHARHAHRWLFASTEVEWAADVLSQASAAPTIVDRTRGDLMHFQSRVNYDPRTDSGIE